MDLIGIRANTRGWPKLCKCRYGGTTVVSNWNTKRVHWIHYRGIQLCAEMSIVADIKHADRFQDVCRRSTLIKANPTRGPNSIHIFLVFLFFIIDRIKSGTSVYREHASHTRNFLREIELCIRWSASSVITIHCSILGVGSSPSVKHNYSHRGSRLFSLIKDWIPSKSIGRVTRSTRKEESMGPTTRSRVRFSIAMVKMQWRKRSFDRV